MDKTIASIRRAHEGDKEARDTLITENLGLVWSVVKRFYNRGCDSEELFQIGSIGLMKAIDRFDISFEVRFSTYAVPVIMGEIRRFLRDDGMVKVSRSMKDNGYKVANARKKLNQDLLREPTMEELSVETQLSIEEIVVAMEANEEVESIYKSVYQSDGNEIYLVDQLMDKQDEHEKLENHLLLESLLSDLTEPEQKLIRMRYFDNLTQSEAAKQLGTSQVQVSRMEKKLLLRMRKTVIQG